MSKSDILCELRNLARGDRREILERIWEMEEADMLRGALPDPEEKALLDIELRECQASPDAGADWKEVEPRLRSQLGR
jgi:hypothetical protein